jgi:hypothetical protein
MVPVASITWRMSPFSTLAVKYSASVFRVSRNAAKTATATISSTTQIQLRLISPKFSFEVRWLEIAKDNCNDGTPANQFSLPSE